MISVMATVCFLQPPGCEQRVEKCVKDINEMVKLCENLDTVGCSIFKEDWARAADHEKKAFCAKQRKEK